MSTANKLLIVLALMWAAPSGAAVDAHCKAGCGDLDNFTWVIADTSFTPPVCANPYSNQALATAACSQSSSQKVISVDRDFEMVQLCVAVLSDMATPVEDCLVQASWGPLNASTNQVVPGLFVGEKAVTDLLGTAWEAGDLACVSLSGTIPAGSALTLMFSAYSDETGGLCTGSNGARWELQGRSL